MPSATTPGHDAATSNDQLNASFFDSRFDPVNFLNNVLPTPSLSSQAQTAKSSRSSQMLNASSEVQTLLSKVNAHNIRSSSELTSLTDEILRSGNRLAYEVEILRGDVNNFYEVLTETLKEDISQFVQDEVVSVSIEPVSGDKVMEEQPNKSQDPAFITQLRTLSRVKARLEAVISIFGEAMKWPLPPSDLSMANSLISVSAPELGMQSTEEDDKAREVTRVIKAEIQGLLDSDGGGQAGLEAATKRVEQYRLLTTIWKGTIEEKARARLVESLSKLVDDRRRALETRGMAYRSKNTDPTQRSASAQGRLPKTDTGGLFRNLARLKDDLYLD